MSTIQSRMRFGALFIIAFVVAMLFCARQGFAQQPLVIGELNVNVVGTGHETVQIRVSADYVFGSRSDWYQEVSGWNLYTDYGTFVGQHIDRGGGPNEDTIGYAKYYVRINNRQIYVDFRDADYETAAYNDCDIWLRYSLAQNKFYQIVDGDTVWTESGSGVGIWDNGRKSSGSPRIPVTVQNSCSEGNGGNVKVDGSYQNSPYQTIWPTGNHSVEAHIFIPGDFGDYYFSSWSDGGARSHTVSTTVDDFAMILTAYFTLERRAPGMLSVPAQPLAAYPNPFNPSTIIRYDLSERSRVLLTISNTLGQQVAELVNTEMEAGRHEVRFDAQALASGLYYCRLQQGGRIQMLRVLLVK